MFVTARRIVTVPTINCKSSIANTFRLSQSIHSTSAPPSGGFLQSLIRKVGEFGRRTTAGSAKSLFARCSERGGHPYWHTYGYVGNDFRAKHMLLVVHVWLIHRRLFSESKQGLLVQEALFDELWEDTANRIRAVGISELSVNKYLKEVQGYSFRCCVEFDHLFKSNNLIENTKDNNTETVLTPQQVVEEIGGVLWRMVYLRREEVPDEIVLEFAKYLQVQTTHLASIPRDNVFTGQFQWAPMPDWKKAKHSTATTATATSTSTTDSTTTDTAASSDSKSKENWREATTTDGKAYYWNVITKETTWEKPI